MTILVGTDGTGSATAAVEWAADEAQRLAMVLRIVHVLDRTLPESQLDIGNEHVDAEQVIAKAITTAARSRARAVAPQIDIEIDTLIGRTVPRLLEASEGAEILVLGSRGRGGPTGLMLGSVARRLAIHATGRVGVVRGPAPPDGPVLAGIDDSPAADQVLAAAFEMADRRDSPLTIVRAHPAGFTSPARAAADRESLENQIAPWRTKHADVPVEMAFTRSAASELLAATAWAQLVVIGSVDHGPVAGTVFGSAGLQLLHHADCPVLIARPPV
jgi:nucleotide-binding universal stress UspA family protein